MILRRSSTGTLCNSMRFFCLYKVVRRSSFLSLWRSCLKAQNHQRIPRSSVSARSVAGVYTAPQPRPCRHIRALFRNDSRNTYSDNAAAEKDSTDRLLRQSEDTPNSRASSSLEEDDKAQCIMQAGSLRMDEPRRIKH